MDPKLMIPDTDCCLLLENTKIQYHDIGPSKKIYKKNHKLIKKTYALQAILKICRIIPVPSLHVDDTKKGSPAKKNTLMAKIEILRSFKNRKQKKYQKF